MDDLQKRGAKLIYDPQFIAHRRPRPTLKAFCKMLFNYGRGRAEQFRLHPTRRSLLNFVPPLFILYVGILPVLFVPPLLSMSLGPLAFAPLAPYFLAVLVQTLASIPAKGFLRSLLAMPLLVASHVFYGLGFWRGLTTRLKAPGDKPTAEVQLESMPLQ